MLYSFLLIYDYEKIHFKESSKTVESTTIIPNSYVWFWKLLMHQEEFHEKQYNFDWTKLYNMNTK